MLRKAAIVALLPMLATGVGAQAVPIQGQMISGSADVAAPGRALTVKVLPPERRMPLRYVVSEPAYVAAFVIYPGAGVRLLYPEGNSAERVQWAGYHTEQLFQSHFDDDLYNVVLGPTRGLTGGPAYLYVIASRYPLDVNRYVHRPARLASAVGQSNARSFNVDVAFEALVNNALSIGDESSWDADVYMLWPPGVTERSASRIPFVTLRCASGAMMRVPANYPFFGCPGDARLMPRAATSTAAPVQQTASVERPTVLPTIVGVRRVPPPPDGKMAPQVTAFTAATGVTSGQRVDAPNAPTSVTVIERPILLDPARSHERGEAWRETHRRMDPSERNERNSDGMGVRDRSGDAAQMRAPRLAPPRELAPAPRLAPNPDAAPRSRPESPRQESPRIERAAPPMASPAPSAASTGHGAVNASPGAPSTPKAGTANQQ